MNNDAQSETKKFSALAKDAAEQIFYQEVTRKVTARAKELAISFANKDKDIDNATWLTNELVHYRISEKKAALISNEIISAVERFNSNFTAINKACAEGKNEKQWLNTFVNENVTADIQQKGDYLAQINTSLTAGNAVAEKVSASNATPEIFAEFEKVTQTPLETPANPSNWNIHTIRNEINQISDQAELMNAAALADTVTLPVEENPISAIAETGIFDDTATGDFNLKMISAAAMKVAGVVDNIPLLNTLPISALTNIACVGVESIKNLINVARGKIPAFEAVKKTGRATVAAVADFIKSGFPATFFMAIPAVGPYLSLTVGTYLRSLSTEKIQEKIYKGIEKVKPIAKKIVSTVKSAAKKVTATVKSAVNKIFSFFNF